MKLQKSDFRISGIRSPLISTEMGAGPVFVESTMKLVGLPGNTLPFSNPGPDTFTLLASAGPSPLPP